MNDKEKIDMELQAYIDGDMTEQEQTAFLSKYDEAELQIAMNQCSEIDNSLKRIFQAGDPPLSQLAEISRLNAPTLVADKPKLKLAWPAALLALAASIALVGFSTGWFLPRQSTAPFFEQTSLVSLYDDALENGFEPYYECDDAKRFAEVFKERQGVGLALAEFPENTRMLGLSYPGGLSRDTTSMLCIVDEQKAIVFVDRLKVDSTAVTELPSGRDDLFIHRAEKFGLVFYEVSPFSNSRIIKFMDQPHLFTR